jgi:dihydroorotase
MLIKNCKVLSSLGVREGDILIEGEKILKVGRGLKGAGEVIDTKGMVVMPGVVDAHVHVRDFNERLKEDFTSASTAALAGGVTTFLEMPNTSPEINNLEILRARIKAGEKHCLIDFGTHIGFPNQLEKLNELDVPSVKIYMERFESPEAALASANLLNTLISLHCEDPRIITRNVRFASDEGDFLLHGDIREKKAETGAVKIAADFAAKHRKRVHICHVTLPKSVSLLNRFTTSEVTPHHMLLTEKDVRKFGGVAKTNPPLRTKLDVYRLWQAVKRGRISIIASDHAPHTLEEKGQNVLLCPPGIPNLEVTLRLMLDVVNRGALKLTDLARMMCENPARIFNLKNKGFIKPGLDADLLILDLKRESKIDPAKFYSKARYSPFEGRKTTGDVKTVILRGKKAFEEEVYLKPGQGRYLYRQL